MAQACIVGGVRVGIADAEGGAVGHAAALRLANGEDAAGEAEEHLAHVGVSHGDNCLNCTIFTNFRC